MSALAAAPFPSGRSTWCFSFRLAAIAQVYKRGLDGNASSPEAVTLGEQCRQLADAAWTLVEQRPSRNADTHCPERSCCIMRASLRNAGRRSLSRWRANCSSAGDGASADHIRQILCPQQIRAPTAQFHADQIGQCTVVMPSMSTIWWRGADLLRQHEVDCHTVFDEFFFHDQRQSCWQLAGLPDLQGAVRNIDIFCRAHMAVQHDRDAQLPRQGCRRRA